VRNPCTAGTKSPSRISKAWRSWIPRRSPPPHTDPEKEAVDQIHAAIKDAGDQTLVDELRLRGWTVICSKKVEKVVFETVEI